MSRGRARSALSLFAAGGFSDPPHDPVDRDRDRSNELRPGVARQSAELRQADGPRHQTRQELSGRAYSFPQTARIVS